VYPIANAEQATVPSRFAEEETGYLDKYSIKESSAGETALLLNPRHPNHVHDTVHAVEARSARPRWIWKIVADCYRDGVAVSS
jgi:hypothetical protein